MTADAYNFHPGAREHVPLLRRVWCRLTWWRQDRAVVTAIDHATGSVTAETLRWSWRRWRWER